MRDGIKILAIETTGPLASVALSGCGEEIIYRVNRSLYSHLEEVAPMVKAILEESGTDPRHLDAVAVSRGPGSFTGIRIGMACAKGLALVWNKPVIEIPTLAAFAFGDYGFLQEAEFAGKGEIPVICPIFDARRSQVYAGVYRLFHKEPLVADAAWDIPEYLEMLGKLFTGGRRAVFFGDGAEVCKELLESSGLPCVFAPPEQRFQSAKSGLRLALELFEDGRLHDAFSAKPEYLRLAEAERKLKQAAQGHAAKEAEVKAWR